MVRSDLWPEPVTQIVFHSLGAERKRVGQKEGERRSERVSQRQMGRREEKGERMKRKKIQETFAVEWTSRDNPWHTAF